MTALFVMLHFHLLPRTFKDDLYERSMKYETDMFAPLTPGEIVDIVRLLRASKG